MSSDVTQRDTCSQRLAVALVGGNLRAASILRLLSEVESVHVVVVVSSDPSAPVIGLAEELDIGVTTEVTELFSRAALDFELVIDMSDDPQTRALIESQAPPEVESIGSAGSQLLWDLLVARKRGEEQERTFVELQMAYDRIRSDERRLQAGKDALEHVNSELEDRLAEAFFTHEFFKALTTCTSVEDVCSLIVDGANGILGAEISCVYLLDHEGERFVLRASQGRGAAAFESLVPLSDTILGAALKEGFVEEAEVPPSSPTAGWARDPDDVRSQAAVPLRSGEGVIGILLVASATHRKLGEAEVERLLRIGNQAAISLQNALLHEKLERLSVTDRLTELYNHGYFHERLDMEIERATRFGHPLCLIMLDIDDFKEFNDTYGHPSGDMVLRRVAEMIRENLREIDVAARYGGEEFVLMLPETDVSGALSVAERVRSTIEESKFATLEEGHSVHKTASLGVAAFPEHAGCATLLVDAADRAMYDAKRAGKNRVKVAT